MIMETAFIAVTPGLEADFEVALEEAKKVISQAPGFEVLHLHRGIERSHTYLLAIGWRTLEDHTEGFRESELFPKWRAIIGPFFAEAPHVEHWTLLP
ncbi:MAG TPA: antibiotic biosynthesis monooxygenase [Candidatus Nanopelagicaceae bacterium]|nr:antibiotic biosynthesis monooxygenase [Candidatus Nanopelagicaceae bacterium]